MPEVDIWMVPAKYATKWLHNVLAQYADPLEFAKGEHGKPYLSNIPELKFNLSHSHEWALIAVAWRIDVGIDIERYRPLPECLRIAERFFPPMDAAALADVPASEREREFFRRWTAIEAKLKACGLGLYGAGREVEGEWSIQPVEVGPDYAASVAANCREFTVRRRELALPSQT